MLYEPAARWCWTKYVGPEGAALMGVHLDTLDQLRGPNGERVERDDSFTPRPLSECEPVAIVRLVRGEELLLRPQPPRHGDRCDECRESG